MGQITENAKVVYAAGPSSDPFEPNKADIVRLFQIIEALLTTAVNGLVVGNTIVYATRAALFADLARPANTLGIVYNDSTPAYNGIYVKAGASGTGSWSLTNIALPSTFAADLAAVIASQTATQAEVTTARGGEANLSARLQTLADESLTRDNDLGDRIDDEIIDRTAAIETAISNILDGAPGTLDTLNKLAAALGDDPNFATTVAEALDDQSAALVQEKNDRLAGDEAVAANIPPIQQDISDLNTGLIQEKDERLGADANLLWSVQRTQLRPGDVPQRFGNTGVQTVGASNGFAGNVLRATGANILYLNEQYSITPGRIYRIRMAASRYQDASAPDLEGQYVRMGVNTFNSVGGLLSPIFLFDAPLTVADGEIVGSAIFSFFAGALVDRVFPSSARKISLYLETFGTSGQTDAHYFYFEDVTEAVNLRNQETFDRITTDDALSDRIDALVSQVTPVSPAGVTFIDDGGMKARMRNGDIIGISVPGWTVEGVAQSGNYVSYARAPGTAYTGDPGSVVDELLNVLTLPDGITKVEFWILYGQSYMQGYMDPAGPVTLTAVRPGRVMMFNWGTRLEYQSAVNDPDHITPPIPLNWLTSLTDAKERLATDYPDYRPSETPCSGFGYAMTADGATPADTLIVVASVAVGGAAIEHLVKGTTAYANMLRVAQRMKVIAAIAGVELEFPEVQWGQGIGNAFTSYASYKAILDQLQVDLDEDLREISGQTETVVMGMIQPADFPQPYSAPIAALDLAIEHPDRFRMGPPMFQYPYYDEGPAGVQNNVHLLSQGNRNMGEDMGRAASRRRYGGITQTQLFISQATRSGAVITATVAGAEGALSASGGVTDPGNLGIVFKQTGGNSASVQSVSIVGGTLVVTLTETPTGTNQRIEVAGVSSFDGTGGGPTAGPRSPIHDSAGAVRADGSTANKYLAIQSIAVT